MPLRQSRPCPPRTLWRLAWLPAGLCLALLPAFEAAAAEEEGPGAPPPAAPELPGGEDRAADTADPEQVAKDLGSGDLEVRSQAVAQAAGLQHAVVTGALLRQLGREQSAGLRLAIVGALAGRSEPADRRKASGALVSRLGRLGDHVAEQGELLATIQALGRLGQAEAVKPLIDGIDNETPAEEARARLMAVADIPHVEAIDRLIQFLSKFGKGRLGHQRDAARDALARATGQKLGNDPDAWRSWWRAARSDFDFEAAAAARAATEQSRDEKARAREAKHRKQDERDGAEPK